MSYEFGLHGESSASRQISWF